MYPERRNEAERALAQHVGREASGAGLAASISLESAHGEFVLAASGPLTIRTIAELEKRLTGQLVETARQRGSATAVINGSRITAFDTAGAWLIDRFSRELADGGIAVRYEGVRPAHRSLIDVVAANRDNDANTPAPRASLAAALSRWRDRTAAAAADALALFSYLGLFISGVGQILTRPNRLRLTAFVHHLDHAGVRAAPIIALICFLIGAVIMQQAALQLSYYGADVYAVDMLGMLGLREVGALLTAVMVAGRSASAFTAEIGAMKMREEIAAMRVIGIDPALTLIVPRVLALLIAVPLLTFLGDIACLAGGAAVAVLYLDQDLASYLARLEEAVELRHFMAGMIKTPFAALIIALVGCSEGMKVAGSAESLGQHVTRAVVKAIFLVIIIGAALSMFLASIGI